MFFKKSLKLFRNPLDEKDYARILSLKMTGDNIGEHVSELLIHAPFKPYDYLNRLLEQKTLSENEVTVFIDCFSLVTEEQGIKLLSKISAIKIDDEKIRYDILKILVSLNVVEYLAKTFLSIMTRKLEKDDLVLLSNILLTFFINIKSTALSEETFIKLFNLFAQLDIRLIDENFCHHILIHFMNHLYFYGSLSKTVLVQYKEEDYIVSRIFSAYVEVILETPASRRNESVIQLIECIKRLDKTSLGAGVALTKMVGIISPAQKNDIFQWIKSKLNGSSYNSDEGKLFYLLITACLSTQAIDAKEADVLYARASELPDGTMYKYALSDKNIALAGIAKYLDQHSVLKYWQLLIKQKEISKFELDNASPLFKRFSSEVQVHELKSLMGFLDHKDYFNVLPCGVLSRYALEIFAYIAEELSTEALEYIKQQLDKVYREKYKTSVDDEYKLSQIIIASWNASHVRDRINSLISKLYIVPETPEEKLQYQRRSASQDFS